MSRAWVIAIVAVGIFCLLGVDLLGKALVWLADFSGIFGS